MAIKTLRHEFDPEDFKALIGNYVATQLDGSGQMSIEFVIGTKYHPMSRPSDPGTQYVKRVNVIFKEEI